jgi:hypothetical protein
MKILSHKLLSFTFAVALLFTAASCKKEKVRSYSLRGSLWNRVESYNTASSITFAGDSVIYYVRLKPTDIRPVIFKGTFVEQGNKLTMLFAPNNFNGLTVAFPEFKPPVSTPGFYTLFDNATYHIQGTQLSINYTGYSAGQPRPVSATFLREIDAD